MKSVTLAAFAMVMGLALSAPAFAQGRHDEKPHATGKPAAASSVKEGVVVGSGRHDEKPHGMRKPPVKKDATKTVDDKAGK